MSASLTSRAQTFNGDGTATDVTVKCYICNKTDKLLRCARCKAIVYCSKEHQKFDWKRHKAYCNHQSSQQTNSTFSAATVTSKLFSEIPNKSSTSKQIASTNLTENIVSEISRIQTASHCDSK